MASSGSGSYKGSFEGKHFILYYNRFVVPPPEQTVGNINALNLSIDSAVLSGVANL
ncbi:UNVERIFIED_CONTAM: hypothetical protein Sindi_1998900, partial [Sesamum indicum]